MEARGKWHIFSGVERQELSPRLLGEIFFRNEGKIKTFLNEGTSREFVTSRPNFKKCLEKVF